MSELDDSGDIDVLNLELAFASLRSRITGTHFGIRFSGSGTLQNFLNNFYEETPMQAPVILLTLMLLSSNAYANCITNERGRVVCSNGSEAGGYNSGTGTAWKSSRNENGVATTQTSRGGTAKTKNGKGVYQSPNGKDCYKTASSHGCN